MRRTTIIVFTVMAAILTMGCMQATDGYRPRPIDAAVLVDPHDANLRIRQTYPTDDVLSVRIRVAGFGMKTSDNGRLTKSDSVAIHVRKPGFVTQRYIVRLPNRVLEPRMASLSGIGKKRREAFIRLARTYNTPVAYPTYIPSGFKLQKAEFRKTIGASKSDGRGSARLVLVWTKGKKTVKLTLWPKGTQPSNDTFKTDTVRRNHFALDLTGLNRREARKVIGGMREKR